MRNFMRVRNVIPQVRNGTWSSSVNNKKLQVAMAVIIVVVLLSLELITFSLNLTTDNFITRFNQAANEREVEASISNLSVDAEHKFGLVINEKTAIKGVVNSDGSIRAVALLVSGDGTAKGGIKAILSCICLISAMNSTMSLQEQVNILNNIGLTEGRTSGELIQDNIKYRFSTTDVEGAIALYITRPYDPVYNKYLMKLVKYKI